MKTNELARPSLGSRMAQGAKNVTNKVLAGAAQGCEFFGPAGTIPLLFLAGIHLAVNNDPKALENNRAFH